MSIVENIIVCQVKIFAHFYVHDILNRGRMIKGAYVSLWEVLKAVFQTENLRNVLFS